MTSQNALQTPINTFAKIDNFGAKVKITSLESSVNNVSQVRLTPAATTVIPAKAIRNTGFPRRRRITNPVEGVGSL
jgi:hypothetical protein